MSEDMIRIYFITLGDGDSYAIDTVGDAMDLLVSDWCSACDDEYTPEERAQVDQEVLECLRTIVFESGSYSGDVYGVRIEMRSRNWYERLKARNG